MQARYYDPVIGRFYSNDPIGFRDVHSFNRYAYVNNNPYKFVDPFGMAPNTPMGQEFREKQCEQTGKCGNTAAAMNLFRSFFDETQDTADTAKDSLNSVSDSVVNTIPAGVRQNPGKTTFAVAGIIGGGVTTFTCPVTGIGCVAGPTTFILSTDQLHKILSQRTTSVIEDNLYRVYANPVVRRAFPFIQSPQNASDNTILFLQMMSGVRDYNKVIRGQGNFVEAVNSISLSKDILSQ